MKNSSFILKIFYTGLLVGQCFFQVQLAQAKDQGHVRWNGDKYEWTSIEYLIENLKELIPNDQVKYCQEVNKGSLYTLSDTPIDLYFEKLKSKNNSACDFGIACETSKKICFETGSTFDCMYGPYSGFSIERMKEQPVILFERMEFTESFFYRFLSDPENINHCCKESEKCKEHFKKTELKISAGKARGDVEDHAFHKTSLTKEKVFISDEFILACKNKSCIEKLVMHELGHACQNSRRSVLGRAFRPTKDKTIEDMEVILGKETSKCIKNVLDKDSKNTKAKHYLNRWYLEALAESIYFHKWSAMHLPTICGEFQDENHSVVQNYLPCLFQKNINNFCPSGL